MKTSDIEFFELFLQKRIWPCIEEYLWLCDFVGYELRRKWLLYDLYEYFIELYTIFGEHNFWMELSESLKKGPHPELGRAVSPIFFTITENQVDAK